MVASSAREPRDAVPAPAGPASGPGGDDRHGLRFGVLRATPVLVRHLRRAGPVAGPGLPASSLRRRVRGCCHPCRTVGGHLLAPGPPVRSPVGGSRGCQGAYTLRRLPVGAGRFLAGGRPGRGLGLGRRRPDGHLRHRNRGGADRGGCAPASLRPPERSGRLASGGAARCRCGASLGGRSVTYSWSGGPAGSGHRLSGAGERGPTRPGLQR